MGLSSNTLWHQTKKDGLKGIIKDKCLYISYSIEEVSSAGYNAEFAYPMVSVCDLPLAETGNYLKKYGEYDLPGDRPARGQVPGMRVSGTHIEENFWQVGHRFFGS